MKGFIEVERIISEHTIQTESINIKPIIKFYGYFSTDEVFWRKRDFCRIVFEGGKEIKVAETYKEIKQKIKQAQGEMMEDRFRFRAWRIEKKSKFNNIEGKMIYNAEDVYDGSLSGFCENENNNNDGHISCFGEYLGRDTEYIIMQSTGLKDKNGKLIYEGDIVKLPTQCNKELHGSYSLQEIVWRNGNWVLSYISSEKGCKLPRGWTACFMYYQWLDGDFDKEFVFCNDDFYCTYNNIEIIGNIYENKELLEEQK